MFSMEAEQKIQGFVVDGFLRRVFCFGIGRGFVWFCEFLRAPTWVVKGVL